MTDANSSSDNAQPRQTVANLVAIADREVGSITPEQAQALIGADTIQFIDVRDVRELAKTGRIPGARHCPRGMLEFWIDPESKYHKPLFGEDKRFVFYCAGGWRSALAAQTAKQMGLTDVTHMSGGMTAWLEDGRPVEDENKPD